MTPKPDSFTCPSCGASVLYTNKFCSYCGTQFDDSEPKIFNRNGRRYKSLCANCYIPRQETLFMDEDYIYKTVIEKIAKGMVDKLIADKMIKIESNYLDNNRKIWRHSINVIANPLTVVFTYEAAERVCEILNLEKFMMGDDA